MNAAANEKTMFGDNFVIFFLYAAATSHYICVPSMVVNTAAFEPAHCSPRKGSHSLHHSLQL